MATLFFFSSPRSLTLLYLLRTTQASKDHRPDTKRRTVGMRPFPLILRSGVLSGNTSTTSTASSTVFSAPAPPSPLRKSPSQSPKSRSSGTNAITKAASPTTPRFLESETGLIAKISPTPAPSSASPATCEYGSKIIPPSPDLSSTSLTKAPPSSGKKNTHKPWSPSKPLSSSPVPLFLSTTPLTEPFISQWTRPSAV